MSGKIAPYAVTNGLALYLDAANPSSYPGSGTTWYDLSGNQNHFTLFNTPTYTSTSLDFNYNGGNQFAQCVNNTFGNFGSAGFTLEYTFNITGSFVNTYGTIITKRNSTCCITSGGVPGWFWNPAGLFTVLDNLGANIFNPTPPPTYIAQNNGNWYNGTAAVRNTNVHYTHTVQTNGNDVTASFYKNGVLQSSYQHTSIGTNNSDNNVFSRLMYGSGQNEYSTGSLFTIKAYNRPLSIKEITQNYQIVKNRYNIT
jgi:hypothetical protein